MKTLILIQGKPGSGKTTLGAQLKASLSLLGHSWERQTVLHTEPDFFFYDNMGNRRYDESKVIEAHTWCKVVVKAAMKESTDTVIISHQWDNDWQKSYFYKLAKQYEYTVQEIFCRAKFKTEAETIDKLIDVVNNHLQMISNNTEQIAA